MPLDLVTGAFGFTGRAIAERLLADGRQVRTLTRRTGVGDPLADRVDVRGFGGGTEAELVDAFEGVETLYNTYWVRFPRGDDTFEAAIVRSEAMLAAARRAGVRRIVHVSVVNAATDAETPYVRAKAVLEAIVRASTLDWVIVRPTLTYGSGDILINNLAWALRRLPVYGLPGRGRYTVQPVHVNDVARICVEAGTRLAGTTIDAAGPEILRYRELVELVRRSIGSRALVLPMPHAAVHAAARLLGPLLRDVVLTRDEIRELTSSLLTSHEPPLGVIRISNWVVDHAASLGRRWSSELARNYTRGG